MIDALDDWNNPGGSPAISSCQYTDGNDLARIEEDGADAPKSFGKAIDFILWYNT